MTDETVSAPTIGLDGLDLARIRAGLRLLTCAVRSRLDDAGRDRA
jgi:hypothetical protein